MVVRLERTAAQHVDAHRLEVVARRERVVEDRAGVGLARHLFVANAQRLRSLVERNVLDEPNRLHAGKRSQAIHELEIEARERRAITQVRALGRDLKREDVLACS